MITVPLWLWLVLCAGSGYALGDIAFWIRCWLLDR